ncbi:MAG: dihydrofolate reductase [Methylotenera sp.]|nr:dihydrofolate reductase [Methylotenera sp.]
MCNLSIIVAVAHRRVIGVNNTLPWHLPEDLKRFRALTTGHHIIMGRKTYESLGRLLPNRTTVIVTQNPAYKVEGALMASSLESALLLCENDEEPFLIGGASLYQAGLKFANKLYMTKIDLEVAGDAFFPEIESAQWQLVAQEQHVSANGLAYCDLLYLRK